MAGGLSYPPNLLGQSGNTGTLPYRFGPEVGGDRHQWLCSRTQEDATRHCRTAAVTMAVGQLPKSSSDPEISSTRPARPKFHHRCTNDRIREGSGTPPLFFSMTGKIRKDRKSVFREVGLDTEEPNGPYFSEHEFGEITGLASPTSTHRPDTAQGNTSDDGKDDTEQRQPRDERDEAESPTSPSQKPWYSRLTPGRRPRVRTASSAPPPSVSSFTRLSTIALLIAVVIPAFSYYKGAEEVAPLAGADAGVIYYRDMKPGPILETRADSPTKACKRWAHQSELTGCLLCVTT